MYRTFWQNMILNQYELDFEFVKMLAYFTFKTFGYYFFNHYTSSCELCSSFHPENCLCSSRNSLFQRKRTSVLTITKPCFLLKAPVDSANLNLDWVMQPIQTSTLHLQSWGITAYVPRMRPREAVSEWARSHYLRFVQSQTDTLMKASPWR